MFLIIWDFIFNGGDIWVLNEYDIKTGNIVEVPINSVGWSDFIQLKYDTRDLQLIYSYNDITYNYYERYCLPISGYSVGDVVFHKTSEFVISQDYITDVSELPKIVNNIIIYILPFCLFFFGIILLIILIKRVVNRFM